MKKIFVPGLITSFGILIVSMLYSMAVQSLIPSLMKEYCNIGLFRPWKDPLMSLYFLYPFALGFIYAWFWNKAKSIFKGKSIFQRGLSFGTALWLVSSLPGMLITYSSFQLSLTIVLTWTLGGLISAIVAGTILAKLNK
jgi:hypothetical protein